MARAWLSFLALNLCLNASLQYFYGDLVFCGILILFCLACIGISFLKGPLLEFRAYYTWTHVVYLSTGFFSGAWSGAIFFHLMPLIALKLFPVARRRQRNKLAIFGSIALVSHFTFLMGQGATFHIYDIILHFILFLGEIFGLIWVWAKQKSAEIQRLTAKDQRSKSLQVLLGVFCHDLSTPMMAISLICFQKRHSPILSEEEKGAWNEVHHLIERERYLIENIRKVEKIASGVSETMDLNCVFPEDLFEKIEDIFGERLQGKDISFKFLKESEDSDPLGFLADENILIYNIITNLMTNAIKFSDRGGTITLGAYRQGNSVSVYVEDQGVGMSQEHVANLLEGNILRSTQRGTENEKGTGLGIKIVKNFVEVLGGTLAISSRLKGDDPENHGTRFVVSFVEAPAQEATHVA
ncbi:Signal transduction histidine kinase [Pseudobacteriovorax antillogorgiicola]|uniref:histidine kinase n=2 Tax=Pseudobacteriovorax antillogorgiicola TaxID=1513793 RepID=A0A1Y6CTM6_9BACT|nr:signal transduction histidine kinase [Pseudobacteriovorax antillogorgiicola]SMF76214.1 Signal transduction histidine kinase [Pseudobacteriovorax antillogorgiicola]